MPVLIRVIVFLSNTLQKMKYTRKYEIIICIPFISELEQYFNNKVCINY